jgi:phosphatidylglycerophosphate synthase
MARPASERPFGRFGGAPEGPYFSLSLARSAGKKRSVQDFLEKAANMASVRTDQPREDEKAALRKRPAELEDPLNLYIYHPLAARLARLLAPTGISPNAVSVAGALMIWVAAYAYTQIAGPLGVLLGLSFHILWHVVDGADGDLARLTGKASPFGEMVDGLCDYAGHSLLYVGLATMVDDQLGIWAWPLGLAAAASHSLQTNHAETQRRSYLWWAYGVPWLKHAKAGGAETFSAPGRLSRTFAWLARRYLSVANSMTPSTATIDEAVEAVATDPRRTKRIRRLVRRAWRRPLIFEQAVGANPRTLIIGLCMAAGSPLAYFLASTLLMNFVLAVSLWYHNRAGRALAKKIARDAARAAG